MRNQHRVERRRGDSDYHNIESQHLTAETAMVAEAAIAREIPGDSSPESRRRKRGQTKLGRSTVDSLANLSVHMTTVIEDHRSVTRRLVARVVIQELSFSDLWTDYPF